MRTVNILICALLCNGLIRADAPQLVQPTQGRPAIVAPGGRVAIVLAGTEDQQPLVALSAPRARVRFDLASELREDVHHVTIPPDTPARTYDLEVTIGAERLVAPRAVAVCAPAETYRVVHLSDMNVGDPTVPGFDRRLIDEINLLAPSLIIATGDYLDATHPAAAAGWTELSGFLAEFEAPVVMARGDHDDPQLYSRFAAPSPLGAVEFGPHVALVLADTPDLPLRDDSEQLRWAERRLSESLGPGGVRLVVSHAPTLDPLALWRERGELRERLASAPPIVWLTGGDPAAPLGFEDPLLLPAALRLIRTPPASSLAARGGMGISRYRVLELKDGSVQMPGGEVAWSVGRLALGFDQPTDGRAARVRVFARSSYPFPIERARLRVFLARSGEQQPWVRGAVLERALDLGWAWECDLRFDLHPVAALVATVGADAPPPEASLSVIAATSRPRSHRLQQEDPPAAANADETVLPELMLRNTGAATCEVAPLLRLGGQTIAYSVAELPAPAAAAAGFRLRLEAGQSVTIQPQPITFEQPREFGELLVILRSDHAWELVRIPLSSSAAVVEAPQ